MHIFLLPLLFGFACNLVSAFTTTIFLRFGERRGAILTVLLRDVLGIPMWAIGFLLAVLAPAPGLFDSTAAVQTIGWLLIAAGGAIILAALVSIRRVAARPSLGDPLIQRGLYAHVRHPIHTGTLFEFLGLLLLTPTRAVALACALGVAWVFAQTRLEEIDLLRRLPEYRDYMRAVPSFLPRLQAK
jgi:protein-S-isoprenylcysteine O-methyltransferase Ste14